MLAEVAIGFVEQMIGQGEAEEAGDGQDHVKKLLDVIEESIAGMQDDVLALQQLVVAHRRKVQPAKQGALLKHGKGSRSRIRRSRSLGDLPLLRNTMQLMPISEEGEWSRMRPSREAESIGSRCSKFSENSLRRPLKTIAPFRAEEEANAVTVEPTPNPVLDTALDKLDILLCGTRPSFPSPCADYDPQIQI